jgi:ketosteroid isomerase-like protein
VNPAMLQDLLRALSTAFQTQDVKALLRQFSTTSTVTYAGSEPAEKATGPTEIRLLLADLLGRPTAYSFDFRDITFSEHDGLVWLLADGDCTQTGDNGVSETFAYRLTGVLANEDAQWRWLLFAGSEPTAVSLESP